MVHIDTAYVTGSHYSGQGSKHGERSRSIVVIGTDPLEDVPSSMYVQHFVHDGQLDPMGGEPLRVTAEKIRALYAHGEPV